MIKGEDTRECMECRQMLPYEDFDYKPNDDDDDWDCCHVLECCDKCYAKEDVKPDKLVVPVISVEKPVVHARRCPGCDSHYKCNCYDMPSSGYRQN